MNEQQLSRGVGPAASPDERNAVPAYVPRAAGYAAGDVAGEIEVTRTELSPAQYLLGAVIAQAAADCRTALKQSARGAVKQKDRTLAASASRFFLSEAGHSMIHACGMGHEGVRAGIALANTTIRRLGLSADALMSDPEEAWKKVVAKENLAHAAAMNRPRVVEQQPLPFRLVA